MLRLIYVFLFFTLYVIPSYCYNTDATHIDDDSLSVLHESASNYASQGNYVQAIRIEQTIVDYYKEKPFCQDYVISLNNLAAYHSDAGEFEKALAIGCKVIELVNDSIEINLNEKYEIFQHQAIYYENIGDHEKSQEYGHIALGIAKQLPLDTWAYPRSLVFLGFSYSELGDYDNAIRLCIEAKNIYENIAVR